MKAFSWLSFYFLANFSKKWWTICEMVQSFSKAHRSLFVLTVTSTKTFDVVCAGLLKFQGCKILSLFFTQHNNLSTNLFTVYKLKALGGAMLVA